jgi:CheY-like chemotaxis protein
VLVVDDTEANIDLLVEALGHDYELMVAMDGEEDIDTGIELGALDYIIKPFDLTDIQNRVRKHLKNILQK